MMPVIRISDETYARLKKHAQPFEDTPESVISKALTALEMVGADINVVPAAAAQRSDLPKLPQKEFRYPLLMALLRFGGKAAAKDVRATLGPLLAPKLAEGDFENVSTGDPRWWNAACWERSELVKEGLMRDDSERGVWEVSEAGRNLAATLHRREDGGRDMVVADGALAELAGRYWRRPIDARPFLMIGDVVFDPLLPRRVDDLYLSARSKSSLTNAGIVYIGDLVQRTPDELVGMPFFGRKSVNEIGEELEKLGLKFGMTLPGGPIDWATLNAL